MRDPAKPPACEGCPLAVMGKGFVRGEGPGGARIMLVGEAPGENEALTGRPFVGRAGALLDRLLKRAGLDRSQFFVTNTIRCRPHKNLLSGTPYEAGAVAHCRGFLDEEIAAIKPAVIVALGSIAMGRLLGLTGITARRGFPERHTSGAIVVPTYHPSYLLPRAGQANTARLTGVVILDLKRAVEYVDRPPIQPPRSYLLDPSPEEAEIWAIQFERAVAAIPGTPLAWDIETPGKLRGIEGDDDLPLETQILRISFSYQIGSAMSVPWQPEYKRVIRRILSLPTPHVTWNGYSFDIPIVEANGISLRHASQWDGMWAWHLLQSDLPRGLQAVASIYCPEVGPWKQLASVEPARYNAQDADIQLRLMLGIKHDLEARGQWDLYLRHVVELAPLLFEAGREHGVLIEGAERDRLRAELMRKRLELLRRAQSLVGPEFKAARIFRAKPKAKAPLIEVPGTKVIKVCRACGQEGVTRQHTLKCAGLLDEKVIPRVCWKWTPDWETIADSQLDVAILEAGFNPLSQPQMIRYAKAHGHAIPINYKTGNDSLDRKVRAALIKRHGAKHPIYPLAQELQDVQKTLSTYVEGYAPDRAGRIQTSYTFSPSTGRLSSRNVALQNVGARSQNPWAPQVRRMIVPPPGHVFLEADSRAIEAVLTGFFMDDPEYVALAQVGIHDYVAHQALGMPWDPAGIPARRKDPAYEAFRTICKKVVHLSNYSGSPAMMVKAEPDTFQSERHAREMQQAYFRACPKLPTWQLAIRQQAHRQTYLQNPWGYRHYFYHVFDREADGKVSYGDDAKRCVAFLPQSSAAAIMRETLLDVGRSEWRPFTPAILSVHDSVCLAVPLVREEEASEWLLTTMNRPIPQLGGLRIGVDLKRGLNWGAMTKVATR